VTDSENLSQIVVNALDDLKAVDIHVIDVRGKLDITDVMIIASGTSNRHVKALANNVAVEAKNHGVTPLGTEGENEAEWVLVDLGDVVAHIMLPSVRDFYGLERLWDWDVDAKSSDLDASPAGK